MTMPRPLRFPPLSLRLASAVLCLAALAAVGGCNRFTRPRYETIWLGQPSHRVKTKLGQPQQARRDAWIYVHRRPFYSAAILFERGRVSGKLWSFEKVISDEAIREYREAHGGEPTPSEGSKRLPPR